MADNCDDKPIKKIPLRGHQVNPATVRTDSTSKNTIPSQSNQPNTDRDIQDRLKKFQKLYNSESDWRDATDETFRDQPFRNTSLGGDIGGGNIGGGGGFTTRDSGTGATNYSTISIVGESFTSLVEYKRTLFKKKQLAKTCKPLKTTGGGGSRRGRMCVCPVCSRLNRVKDKVAGKNYFKIPFTNIRIPRFDHLFDKIVTFDSNRRNGEVCGICGGQKSIVDVTDDSPRYAAASQMIDENAQKIMEAEAKLGLGGTRTTIIQGSDLLFVGLGFNNNKTYEVIPDSNIAPAMRGGKIPQQNGMLVNSVVGKQGSLGWPQQVGNYTIKCANKFNLLAGAGGITIATGGPLTISAGLMKIVGPQLSIGSSTGPLTLEGDSVNVTGRAVSITPTGGELFVKGNINNTGNITTQGHAHFESVSFAKASCVGVTKSTQMSNANQDVTLSQPAVWSAFALTAAMLDLKTYFQNILTDSASSAFRLLSPKENENLADRMAALTKYAYPIEKLPTGLIMPGTPVSLDGTLVGTFPCNFGGQTGGVAKGIITGTTISPIPLYNFPHTHGIPEMQHKHEVVLPDIDITSSSPVALRGKILNGAHESGVPANPTKDTFARLMEIKKVAVEFAANISTEAIKLASKVQRLFA